VEYIAEKRFPATPKRRREARKKGQVLKSQELTSALMLLALVGLLRIWAPKAIEKFAALFRYAANFSGEWTASTVWKVSLDVAGHCFSIMGPILLVSLATALVANYLQVGPLLTFETIIPKFSRISPLQGLKRMFGLKALVQLAKSLFKVLVIGYFLYAVLRDNFDLFPFLQRVEVGQSVMIFGNLLFNLAWKIALAFLVIALADFLYQWWDYEKNLRMSHEEIKEEYKQTEGDPQLKAQIKKRQRAIAMRRMMEDLKTADVVITNPIHYAVALKYDLSQHAAPFVVAKGQNEMALRIKALAKENGIFIMENKELARSLYAQVELGQVIPQELYKAVAEVLAFVYKLGKRKHYYSA
jgi:flagellar biosynthetic protein FlhB